MTTPDRVETHPPPDNDRVQQALAAMHQRRARLRRRYRIVGASGVTLAAAIVVVIAVTTLSPSGRDTLVVAGSSDATSTTDVPSTSNAPAPISRSSVLSIELLPNPEGPQVRFSAERFPAAFRAALDRLPSTLPAPSGPEECDLGRLVGITVVGGQTLQYGPCTIPESVNAAIDAAIATETHHAVDPVPYERAIQACRTGAPVGTLFSAGPTTIGEIRNPGAQSGVLQIANAFPGSPDTAFAAWCGRKFEGHDQHYAVGPNDEIAIAGEQ